MEEVKPRKASSAEAVEARQVAASDQDAGSEKRRRGRHDIPAEIIAATRTNFLRYGVNRTTMADIARAVGMPRQTLYGYVSAREDLVDAVLVRRIQEIADDLKPLGTDDVAFDDALIETWWGERKGEFQIFDTDDITVGPICKIELPFHMGWTPHGHWMDFR